VPLLRSLIDRETVGTAAGWLAWTRTLQYRRRVEAALRTIEEWRGHCQRPIVSVSGGKDSTALLDLVRRVDPTIPAWRADPPNPLPDREVHVAALEAAAGGEWRTMVYPWDVAAVLAGDLGYPDLLKIRVLRQAQVLAGIDGVALGLRAAESRGRRLNLATRGEVYCAAGRWTCTPLARWSAEEVLGHVLASGLPLNPVYERLHLLPLGKLDLLRDGTWWPHLDPGNYRPWLAYHYPEVLANYDVASHLSARAKPWDGR
jgi:hypothetical protein